MIKALFVLLALGQDAATLSFCENIGDGSHAETMTGRIVITVDLSVIPKGTAIHRAVLRPGRETGEAFQRRNEPVKGTDVFGLALRG